MSDGELFFSLLRINAAQILRAAGLTTAKPSVLDAFTGMAGEWGKWGDLSPALVSSDSRALN